MIFSLINGVRSTSARRPRWRGCYGIQARLPHHRARRRIAPRLADIARPEAPKISSRVPSLKPEASTLVGAGEAELDVANVELDESERDLDEFEGEDPELDDPDEGEFKEEAPEDAEAEALLLSDDAESFDKLYIVDGGVGSWVFVPGRGTSAEDARVLEVDATG